MRSIIRFSFQEAYDRDIPENEIDDFRIYVPLLIQERFSKLFTAYTLETSEGCFIVLLNLENRESHDRLEKTLRELLDSFQPGNGWRTTVSAGIGGVTEHIQDITDSYDDAMTAAVWAETRGESRIMRAGALDIARHFQYTLAEETDVLKLLRSGYEKALTESARRIIGNNAEQPVSWIHMHQLINALYYTGQRDLGTAGNPAGERLSLTSSSEEHVNILLDFFHRIIDRTMPLRDGESIIISAIRRFIDGHFAENIYLQTIADRTNYSPKYISHLFKTRTGFNLSDYINMRRIMKAKELLLHSAMSIGDIQNAVGLPSRTTFIRLFKKYEGTTPTKLRELDLLTGLQ